MLYLGIDHTLLLIVPPIVGLLERNLSLMQVHGKTTLDKLTLSLVKLLCLLVLCTHIFSHCVIHGRSNRFMAACLAEMNHLTLGRGLSRIQSSIGLLHHDHASATNLLDSNWLAWRRLFLIDLITRARLGLNIVEGTLWDLKFALLVFLLFSSLSSLTVIKIVLALFVSHGA